MFLISTDTSTGLFVLAIMGVIGAVLVAYLKEEDWWEDREREVDIFILRLYRISTLGQALFHLVGLCFGGLFFVLACLVVEGLNWLIPVFILLGIFFSLPTLLFINHFFHEALRTVRYDKVHNRLLIEKSGATHTLELNTDDYRVIEYRPRRGHRDILPGAGFGKITIVQGDKKFEFSEMLYSKHERVFKKVREGSRGVQLLRKQLNFFV